MKFLGKLECRKGDHCTKHNRRDCIDLKVAELGMEGIEGGKVEEKKSQL